MALKTTGLTADGTANQVDIQWVVGTYASTLDRDKFGIDSSVRNNVQVSINSDGTLYLDGVATGQKANLTAITGATGQ